MPQCLRRLLFWILRKLNNGEVHRIEVAWAVNQLIYNRFFRFTDSNDRMVNMMTLYVRKHSLERISKLYNIPRERVRQVINKGVRQARNYGL